MRTIAGSGLAALLVALVRFTLLGIVVVVIVTGCGGNESSSQPSTQPAQTTQLGAPSRTWQIQYPDIARFVGTRVECDYRKVIGGPRNITCWDPTGRSKYSVVISPNRIEVFKERGGLVFSRPWK